MSDSHHDRYNMIRNQLEGANQQHLLRFWDELDADQQTALLDDLEQINFPSLGDLIQNHVLTSEAASLPEQISPPDILPSKPGLDEASLYADAHQYGISLIQQGKVAAFTVAGGQGTRLGFDGPKGAFPISPVKQKPLFQLFAEFLIGTNQRYGSALHWFIMTSPQNDAATRSFFEEHDFFGFNSANVHFFKQGVMPAFSKDGKILLADKSSVAFSPDGHGGSLLALKRSGMLKKMAELGIDYLSYIQVDNPLVKVIDPLFIGLHARKRSEMSSKTIPKADDLERVGNFVVGDGQTMVIEYSDLPEDLAHARDAEGNRQFDAGSIAIHVLSRTFIERLTADEKSFGLPWHRAVKKVAHVDDAGKRVEPDEPNAVKLESFIFDAVPLAENPLILRTERAEEFSPVKNAEGIDSVETSQRDLNRRAARWLEHAGADIPRTGDGEPDGVFEISPCFALDAEHLREVLSAPPELKAGESRYFS